MFLPLSSILSIYRTSLLAYIIVSHTIVRLAYSYSHTILVLIPLRLVNVL